MLDLYQSYYCWLIVIDLVCECSIINLEFIAESTSIGICVEGETLPIRDFFFFYSCLWDDQEEARAIRVQEKG